MNDLSTFLSYTALFLIVKWTLSWDNFSTLSMFGEAFICQNQPVGLGFFFFWLGVALLVISHLLLHISLMYVYLNYSLQLQKYILPM